MSESTNGKPVDGSIGISFDSQLLDVRLEHVIPTKIIDPETRQSAKYKQIRSSIREVGIIEPLAVQAGDNSDHTYFLLDGHIRLEAMKDIGIKTATCLLASDDEAFTYNRHINRIAPVQEHRMIMKAIKRGVSEEKIARALNVDIKAIKVRQNLLNGICPEVVEMLKDKNISIGLFPVLRKMNAVRQIQAITLMNGANIYTVKFAQAILAGSTIDQLANPDKPKKIRGLSAEQIVRMENETKNVETEYRLIEGNYGADVLTLTLAKTYLNSLLRNAAVVRYLAKHQSEMLNEFQTIAQLE